VFRDRADAGRRLAELLRAKGFHDPVVLALPRGGVPVAAEVAVGLGAPLEVFVARKVGAPGQPEWGIGAVAEGGAVVSNDAAVRALGLSPEAFHALVARERDEVARRVLQYRRDRPLPDLAGRDAILVDDGLATGVTAEAALRALRALGPRRLVLAVPVAARDTAHRLAGVADEVVCVHAPRDLRAVGQWYDVFEQTRDDEVLAALGRTEEAR
jgi:putative phosphoribosyl transferase